MDEITPKNDNRGSSVNVMVWGNDLQLRILVDHRRQLYASHSATPNTL